MNRTEQEERIKQTLLQLVKKGGNLLTVEFFSSSDGRDYRVTVSSAKRECDLVRLILVEPVVPTDLDSWSQAIVRAEELVDLIEKETIHKFSNPNFFKAMRAQYAYLKNKERDIKYIT